MTKVVIPDIDSGYNLTQINVALQQLATELNDKVLYRDNPAGEPNSMDNNLDMNSFQILNLPAPSTQNSPARLRDVQAAITGLTPASLIPFTPSGSIVATTVQSAIQELDGDLQNLIKTISSFGAAGDGVTDDSAALAAMATSGAKIVDGQGKTYRVVTKVVISAGITILNARFLFDGTFTTRIFDITGDDVTFKDVIFDGNNKQPASCLTYLADNAKRPRFVRCTWQNMIGTKAGSGPLNNMYGLFISPYGVEDFLFDACIWQNFAKWNDGNATTAAGAPFPATVGCGGTGAIFFIQDTFAEPDTIQTVYTSGTIRDCVVENVQTILAASLSANNRVEFDDADGIRFYGSVIGDTRLPVTITNFTTRKVSKRAIKLSVAKDVIIDGVFCDGRGMMYGMVTAIKLDNDCIVRNVRAVAGSSGKRFSTAYQMQGYQNATLEECSVDFCGVGFQILNAVPTQGLKNIIVRNCRFDNVEFYGYYNVSVGTPSQSNIVIDGVRITCVGTNSQGIASASGTDISGGHEIRNTVVINAGVKVEGVNNNIENLSVFITSSAYSGLSPSVGLIEIGSGKGYPGYQRITNVLVRATGINASYLNATRPYLVFVSHDGYQINNLQIEVSESLTVAYPHFEGIGDDAVIEGFSYTGPGFCRQGSLISSSRWSVKNAIRRGSGATAQPFWALNSTAQYYEFQTITDFRPATQPTINSNTATNGIATNVNTRSSHVSGGVAGVAKTANINTF